jgi:hypothetical protein
MATSFERGWPTVFDHSAGVWRYADTGMECNQKRACARCGCPPLSDGEDACCGHLDGYTSVCCGHGVHEPIALAADEAKP